jgi:hypothetical protein
MKITCIQFCAIHLHEENAMYSSSTKVEYATDITLKAATHTEDFL